MVTVKADPRIETKKEVYDAKKKMADRLQQSADKLTEAVDRITEAEETIAKIENSIRGVEGKEADSLRKSSTEIKKEIKKIRESIFGRNATDRQGITRFADITTTSILQTARMDIMSKIAAPTTQTERLVSEAEAAVKESLKTINEFFNVKWKAYREQTESTPMKLFKDYKPID
jgi:predicted  nucleic acid-binding Zn-ribbon protein